MFTNIISHRVQQCGAIFQRITDLLQSQACTVSPYRNKGRRQKQYQHTKGSEQKLLVTIGFRQCFFCINFLYQAPVSLAEFTPGH